MGRRTTAGPEIVVHTSGEVLDGAADYVRRQVEAFVRRMPGRLESVRVKLTAFRNPRVSWPALAQANLVVDGQPVRAQLAARFLQEAGGLLRARLDRQVTRISQPQVPRPWPERPRRPVSPALVSRAPGERELVRRKQFQLAVSSPDEAALAMDVRDYDFHLFVDAETGQDSLVYRVGPTGYRLARVSGIAPIPRESSLLWTVNVHPVPDLTAAKAVELLESTELPYRFFQDVDTGRGSVVYLRYDGHYGLVTVAGTQAR